MIFLQSSGLHCDSPSHWDMVGTSSCASESVGEHETRPYPRATSPSFPLNLFLRASASLREKYWDKNSLSPALSAERTHLANCKPASLKSLGICPRQAAVKARHTKKLNGGTRHSAFWVHWCFSGAWNLDVGCSL